MILVSIVYALSDTGIQKNIIIIWKWIKSSECERFKSQTGPFISCSINIDLLLRFLKKMTLVLVDFSA